MPIHGDPNQTPRRPHLTRPTDPTRAGSGNASHDDAFDTLADLFLGGGSPIRKPTPRPAPIAEPKFSLTRDEIEHLMEPLEATEPEPQTKPKTSTPHRVELVIVGHLPAMASAWVNEFARQTALTAGPRSLVRCSARSIRVDLFDPASTSPISKCALLSAAISTVQASADASLLTVPQGDESAVAGAIHASRLTLLTGADEASVVAAYRKLKHLADVISIGSGGARASVHIVVMGASDRQAAEVFDRLHRVTAAFLPLDLHHAGSIERIGSSHSVTARTLFDGPLDRSCSEVATLLGTPSDHPAPAPVSPVVQSHTPPRQEPTGRRVLMDDHADHAVEIIPPLHKSFDALETHDAHDTVDMPPARPHHATSKPASPRSPQQQPAHSHLHDAHTAPAAIADDTDLASLIDGLTPILARCPHAPRIQLALDSTSRLHLLASGDAADMVAALEVARTWAKAHATLLSLTVRRDIDCEQPAAHIFSECPIGVRRLLDSDLKVHLLSRVTRPGLIAQTLN